MKAMTYRSYGGPEIVTMSDVPTPSIKLNDVLIRILATTVTTADWRARSLSMPGGFGLFGRLVFGLVQPRQPILGTELAGIIYSVGPAVTRLPAGGRGDCVCRRPVRLPCRIPRDGRRRDDRSQTGEPKL